jgi:RNA polymerase-binding transcription factor DksA
VDTNEARERLLAERDRLEAQLSDQADAVADQQSEDDIAASDLAKDILDRELNHSELERARRELAEVNAALERIDNGTYGVSDVSGRPIPDERLQAVPHARRLAEEQELIDNQARAAIPDNRDLRA